MQRRNEFQQIVSGVLLLTAIHVAVFAILGVLAYVVTAVSNIYIISQIILFAFFYIGLSQLFYVIPLVIRLKQRRKWGKMKGVIIGAVITALLNGGCFVWLFSTFR